jgi:hypothetical protein
MAAIIWNISFIAFLSTLRICSSFIRVPRIFCYRNFPNTRVGAVSNEWWKRPEDEDVVVRVPEVPFMGDSSSLFDQIYNSENEDEKSRKYSLSQFTLRDIAEAYQFSLDFLGDFVVQMGSQPPINIDTKLSNLLTGQQIYTLMEALTSLDPYESNADFDGIGVAEIANELDIPVSTVIKICDGEGFNLPFGASTILHRTVSDKIRQVYEYDEYQNLPPATPEDDEDNA